MTLSPIPAKMMTISRGAANGPFTTTYAQLEVPIARVSNLRPGVPNPADRAILEAQVAHLRIRGSLPTRRVPRLAAVLREARGGGYRRFSNGWRSALGDVVRAGD